MPAPSRPTPSAGPDGSEDRTARTVRTTVMVLFAVWLIDYSDRLAINLVLPDIGDEFGLNKGQQGLIVSAFFLAYALCQIPGGLLADRFGARRVAIWALLAWSLFTALTGFAWSFVLLLVVRFAFGVAEGIFPPASAKLVVERTTPERRMGANGLILSSNALASVLTPLALPPLIAAFGWRSAFYSMAALGVFALLALRLWLPAPLPRTEPEASAAPDERRGLRSVLSKGVLWRFAGIMFGYNVIVWGLTTWAPSYLSEERGLSLGEAGPLLAIPALGAAVATVVGGRIADRLGGHHRKVIVPVMTVSALSLPAMAYSDSLVGFGVFATLAVVAASLAYMPIYAVPMRGLPPEYVGVGTAVIIVGGQLAGMVAPPVMGVLADAFSFEAAFAFLVLGALVAAVLAVFTPQDADGFRTAFGPTRPNRPALTTEQP
ncbi:MFS transporter [Streptomyces sp. KLOTTS4A1]|uniref:MFS transporter n=1 Tax=Streptomyces sp. KLOTTS4A1 TaxID=3390996 RepID=UPI0039F5301C